MEFLIQPTTNLARSTQAIGIPQLNWSPVDARNTTVTPSGSTEYPGAERAPRMISLMLVRDRAEELPSSAVAYVQLKVHPEVHDEATQEVLQPAVYQTLATLTPNNPEWRRNYPINYGLLSVYKPQSDEPYGVAVLGMFGQSTSVSD